MNEEQEKQLYEIIHEIAFDAMGSAYEPAKYTEAIFNAIKPRWIPGAPKKSRCYYWLKLDNGVVIDYVYDVNTPGEFLSSENYVYEKRSILAHCPIEEPVE